MPRIKETNTIKNRSTNVENIQFKDMKTHFSQLETLAKIISKWNGDLVSAKTAKESLEQYQKLIGAIKNLIKDERSKLKPNSPKDIKKGQDLTNYADRLKKENTLETKGLANKINVKIKLLESKQATNKAAIDIRDSQSEAALIEIKRLLPLISTTVDAFEKARLEDKQGLHAKFTQERNSLQIQIDLLSDKGTYPGIVQALSHRVNQRIVVLAKAEKVLKEKLLAAAKEAETSVDSMSINEQILALAPPKVQKAVQNLLAGVTTEKLKLLFGGANETGLVTYAVNQVVAVTGTTSSLGQELAVISDLSQEEQLQLAQALLTGESNELTAKVSQSTKMAITAAVINQLAINAKVSKADLVAIQEFSNSLVTNMARVERGEATHLSVLVEVENSDGKMTIRGFHIDLQALINNPVDFSALMAFQLLKVGATSNTPIVTAFTSLEQVGALLQLQGRATSSLALKGRGLQELTADVLKNASSLKQLTNGEVVDFSSKALVAVTQQHHYDIVTSTSGILAGKHSHSKGAVDSSGLVAGVLRALAMMHITTVNTVFNLESQAQLGITPFIGNKVLDANTLGIKGGTEQYLLTDVDDEVDTALSRLPVDTVTEIEITNDAAVEHSNPPRRQVNQQEPSVKEPVGINEQLINDFNKALVKLETLDASLNKKYGNKKDKQYIIKINRNLITSLKSALHAYEGSGDIDVFKNACRTAINKNVKSAFNAQRDGAVKQFFGTIYEAFNNLWTKLFASKERNEARNSTKASAIGFFQSQARTTKSADVLYDFNKDLDKAFKVVGGEADDDSHVIQRGILS